MQRISRASDDIWATGAFDPKKPVAPDWADQPPEPVLRSGTEDDIFGESPGEHHQFNDAMSWSDDSVGAEDPEFDEDDLHQEDRSGTYLPGGDFAPESRPSVPASDLLAIRRHRTLLRGGGSVPRGELVGSDPRGPMAQYNDNSNVAHYYTYNPHDNDGGKPWVVNTTHWQLHDPVHSRHETFEQAVLGATGHKDILRYDMGIERTF